MLHKLKAKIGTHKVLVANFGYLSALQIITMLLPLATYPYLIRVLGGELWGKVILAQTIVSYFIILINFGYDIFATKEVSIYRDDTKKLSEVVSTVFIIKTFFFIGSGILLALILLYVPSLRKEFWLYAFSFGLCINEWIFPIWYFQGIEKMKYITFINLSSKLIFFGLIFLIIKDKGDYLYVPLLNGIGALIGGVMSIWIVFGVHKVKFKLQTMKMIIRYIKESFPLFTSMAIISVKDRFNIIFIGIFLGNMQIAMYDLGIKLLGLFSVFVDTVNKVIYPKIARDRDMRFLRKSIFLLFSAVLVLVIAAQLVLPQIIQFLGGGEMTQATTTIRIMLLSPLFFSIGIPLARNVMILFGRTKAYLISVSITVFFYIALIYLIYSFPALRIIEVFALVVVAVYSFESIYRFIYCKKQKLF